MKWFFIHKTSHIFQLAIETILSCTSKPTDLLRRQKITKKILFKYLVTKGVNVSADGGKSELIMKCLDLWNSPVSHEQTQNSDHEKAILSEEIRKSQRVPYQENSFTEEEDKRPSSTTGSEMAIQFSVWFFGALNTLNEFGSQHFWPNCSLWAQLQTPFDTPKEIRMSGADNVATFLSRLIMFDKYYFHANNSENSVMLEEEEHGLLKILIRGVVHQHSNCVGLFDSAFGLIKNPVYENNYKIQLVKFQIRINKPKAVLS